MHVEAARRFRDVVIAQLVDALDVFPPDPVGRHGIFRWFGTVGTTRQQGIHNVVNVGGLGQVVDGPRFHGGYRGGDCAVARKDHCVRVFPDAVESLNNIKAGTVLKT